MPNYKITDPETGKTIRITGDTPPSEEELTQIFATARGNTPAPQASQQTQTTAKPQTINNPLTTLLSFFAPRSLGVSDQKGSGASLVEQAGVGLGLRGNLDETRQMQDQAFQQSQDLIARARQEQDPNKRQILLSGSRDIDEISAKPINEMVGRSEQILDIEGGKQLQPYERTALGVAGEAAASLAPSGFLGKGASTAGRIGKAALEGVVRGGVSGATAPRGTGEEAFKSGVTNALVGGAIGGAVQGVGEVVGAAGRSLQKPKVKINSEGADRIEKILTKAENVPANRASEAPSVFKRVYQSAFPFSKKGNAFEKLRPEETVDDMIKYGITGSGGEVQTKLAQFTGPGGVGTNVVNDVIASAPNQSVALPDIDSKKLVDRFSDIGEDEVKKQLGRLGRVNTGGAPGQVDLSSMADLERKLSKEAIDDFVSATTTANNKKLEVALLKFDLADELGTSVDQAVGAQAIEQYKDPRVIEYVRKIGGDSLADDFINAKTVSELRALQKSFVRMSRIIDLSNQLPSTLGQRFFKLLSQVPVVGAVTESVLEPLNQKLSTGLAVQGARVAQGAPLQAAANAAASLKTQDALNVLGRLGIINAGNQSAQTQQ